MIRQSESIAALAASLVKAQSEMTNAPKDTRGQVGNQVRYYTDLPTLTDLVRPILARHQLAFIQLPGGSTNGCVSLTTRLVHGTGEWIEDDYSMPSGQGAQGVGSALTYARRYALMALLGVAADDDDGAAASTEGRIPRKRAADPSATTPRTATEAQIKKMATVFSKLQIKERADRLAFIAASARPVDSSKELTVEEAGSVIDALEKVSTGELDMVWINGQITLTTSEAFQPSLDQGSQQ